MRLRSRFAVTLGALFSSLALAVAAPNPASATALACSGFGCDGHDPNIQTWQSGPVTTYGKDLGNSFYSELRWGKTDGDQYGWTRLQYISGSGASNWTLYVQRCTKDHSTCYWRLGATKGGAAAWTAKVAGTANTYVTRTPMYYNPSTYEVRACVEDPSGNEQCTAWY
ncbi:hypothetical protein ELQ87_17820 [Streptomyces griseoviridis]|uniref:Secreted protein n=1 Tax=Streptomyces griseoviridis TaxID=45398 RepID=A0A3S9ZE82_STRGD|nr:hypothetical protein ELQ87_17820 [Streptomyces griseoviridis]QCN87200.1 hypothetical protein DDJ31_21455 [Streptomyces griseoviridis]